MREHPSPMRVETRDSLDETAGGVPPAGPAMQPVYQTPVVTYWLIAVNVLFWLAVAAIGSGSVWGGLWLPDSHALLLLGAKYGPAINAGEYWRLVTAMFLHGGALHLAVNMWALLQLGGLCEVLYGRARFLILYICSGVVGSIASYMLSPVAGVGASGAIFGLLGVALVYSIKYSRELPPGMAERMRRSLVPALILNLIITAAIPIIDKSAHLGGLISGALLAAFTEGQHAPARRREREGLPVPLALLTAVGLLLYGFGSLAGSLPRMGAQYAVATAERRGDAPRAIRLLYQYTLRHPDDPAARERLALLLASQRRWSEAAREFLALSRSPLPRPQILEIGLRIAERAAMIRRGAEAESIYRRLLELEPDHFWVLNGLAYLYADVLETNLDEAEQMAQKALEEMPGNDSALSRWVWDQDRGAILDTLAWVYFKQGKLVEAHATQQQAVRRTGRSPEVRYHMGRIHEAQGNRAAARHEYEIALRENSGFQPARAALQRLRGSASTPPAR